MKIIELGSKIVYTCPQCGCKLQIEDKDWIIDQIDYTFSEIYVKCPCCEQHIDKEYVLQELVNKNK